MFTSSLQSSVKPTSLRMRSLESVWIIAVDDAVVNVTVGCCCEGLSVGMLELDLGNVGDTIVSTTKGLSAGRVVVVVVEVAGVCGSADVDPAW